MFHRPSRKVENQKVFLAIPAYGGLCAGFTFSLFWSADALAKAGIAYELAIYSGDCHVDDARNRLVRDFLEGDCTDLVFIDSDLRWNPDDLVKLLKYDRDVVGGTYPFKQDEFGFPVRLFAGDIVADDDGLIECDGLPTGFLRIKRHVLQTLADKAVKFHPKSDDRSDFPLIFERQVFNGYRRGGDYAFCYKWKETGGKLYMAPEFEFEHFGEHSWTGSFGHWKRTESYGAIKAGVMEIKAGVDTLSTINDMGTAWSSDWAAPRDMLYGLCLVAKTINGDILETGSGISSIVLAAACTGDVYSLEHNDEWADKVENLAKECGLTNLHIIRAPLVDGWYDFTTNKKFDMAMVDGPPRKQGDRSKLFDRCGESIKDAVIFVDDIETPKYMQMVIDNLQNHQVTKMGRFAVCTRRINHADAT